MDDTQELLQERLARLENGESLESCLTGLSEGEAELLRTALLLRNVDYPTRPASVVAAQRAKLLQIAKQKKPMPSNKRWMFPLAFSGAAALALIACLGLALAGLFWLRQTPGQVVANPHTALLAEVRGDVRVQQNGAWEKVKAGQAITAGQRLRTGGLSSATLIFYDQSRAHLGPNTELSVDRLDARTTGPRTIQLTQQTGETDHTVAHSGNPTSIYEVRTPSGSGVAKGTAFHVSVAASLLVRFNVDEGAVAVTNLNVTVIVIAGQTTTIPNGGVPGEPAFRISGEGEVLAIGETWNIAGQTFNTDANTLIIGNPQVGDWVAVEGHLLADGTRVADTIILLRRAPENKFVFTGKVDAIGDEVWVIADREVRVDELTTIDEGIEVGDAVEVIGGIAQDGTFWASAISLLDETGSPFEFTGVVEEIADLGWTISGIAIAIDDQTKIGEGIEVGEVVKVEGHIRDDGTWLAEEIKLAEEEDRAFEITGEVESIGPWRVAGTEFETEAATEIDDGLTVGDRVKVEGRILEDGRWVADEIRRLDQEDEHRFEFVGEVSSIDPWVVSGIALTVSEDAAIEEGIAVGDFVRVKGKILPDGTWVAEVITRLDNQAGCVEITTIVTRVGDGQAVLMDGQTITLSGGVQVEGEVKTAAVVRVRICIADDGTIVIVSITVIYQLETLPTATPTPEVTPTPTPAPTVTLAPTTSSEGDKATVCHKPNGKNPHTITISRSALGAHLAHGDTLGPCP